jgi:hypothetical protein
MSEPEDPTRLESARRPLPPSYPAPAHGAKTFRLKRGFLFGVGSSAVLGVLGALAELLWGRGCTFRANGECQVIAAVISIAIDAPLGVLAIWKANAAAPDKSWLHAIGGWLIGLCVASVAVLALLVVITISAVILGRA